MNIKECATCRWDIRGEREICQDCDENYSKWQGQLSVVSLIRLSHANAKRKGFWDNPREFGTLIALIHSELSEALEADRHGDKEHVAEELTDVAIRLGDLCGGLEIDLESAILAKMEKNKARPPMHGKQY